MTTTQPSTTLGPINESKTTLPINQINTNNADNKRTNSSTPHTSTLPLPPPAATATTTTRTSMITMDDSSITVGGVQLWCDGDLHRLLRGHQPMLLQRLLFSKDLTAFMVEVQDIVSQLLRKVAPTGVSSPLFYDRIIKEMDAIGWQRLTSLDDSLTTIRIRVTDADTRHHIVTVKLEPSYPHVIPICTCDIPLQVSLSWWIPATSTLADIVHHYQQTIDQLVAVYRQLDDIDSHCWVLEPTPPRPRAITMRRIVLGRSCSLQIDIDPRNASAAGEYRFMGADSMCAPLRARLDDNRHKWDTNVSVRLNLERLIGISFPAACTAGSQASADMELSMECGVCYSYRLADATPDRVCDNPKCARPFHRQCLFEWLKGVPTSMPQSFNTVFGACPYCSEPITATAS